MKQSSQPDPNMHPRRARKRRSPRARAADLQARRHTPSYSGSYGPDTYADSYTTSYGTAATLPEHAEAAHDAELRDLELRHLENRRERRRRRVIRKSLLPQSPQMWLVLIAVLFVSVPALRKMYYIHADYRWLQAQVNYKQEQLAALRQQNENAQKRLAVLTSDKGREQLLIENGYVPPGSRILLFQPDPEERRAAEIPKNDLSPHPPSAHENASGSLWQQTGKAVGDWWRGLSQPSPEKPTPEKSADADESRVNAPASSDASTNSDTLATSLDSPPGYSSSELAPED